MFLPIGDDVNKKHLPFVTIALIAVNVFAFLYEWKLLSGAEDSVVEAFFSKWALVPADLGEGYIVGVFTHMFLHGDVMHILGNLVVLWAFAYSLEALLGWQTFLGLYVAWGLLAGLFHAAASWGSEVPLIGASGAIAGVIGAYAVVFGYNTNIRVLFFFFFRPWVVEVSAAVFGGLWFVMQLFQAGADAGGGGGVAWFAHLGGFAAGAATMLWMRHLTESVLVERDGELCFRRRDEYDDEGFIDDAEWTAQHTTQEAEPGQPAAAGCPYCGTDIAAGHPMGETLVRCGNPHCDRVIFLEATGV